MVDQEILMELRTIKTLLAIDKWEELEELTSDFSDLQEHILGLLGSYEWRSLSSSDLAEEFDTGTTTISEHRTELVERNLVEKRGSGRGAEYRITGLLGCAELLGLVDIE